MSLQIVTVENVSGYEIVGIFLTEKQAKTGIAEYISKSGVAYKKKLAKKDSTDVKKLIYVEDTEEDTKHSLFVTPVPFDMSIFEKVKKFKDPNAPKKGLSAFMLFSNDHRAEIKTNNSDASFGEIGRLVGEAWKNLSDKQRSVYVQRSEADKARYTQEFEAYTSSSLEPTPEVTSEPTPEPTPEVTSEATPKENPKKVRVAKKSKDEVAA